MAFTDSINRMSSTTVQTAVHFEELSKSSARGLKADIFSRSRLLNIEFFFGGGGLSMISLLILD